jgi:hypothetical protein
MDPLPYDHPFHRYCSPTARKSLAARLSLPYDDIMQDWEYEVASPERYAALLEAYRREELDEDERFSLGMMLVQCVAELAVDNGGLTPEWIAVEELLREDPWTHGATVSHWMCYVEPHEWAVVGKAMRRLWVEVGPLVLNGGSA